MTTPWAQDDPAKPCRNPISRKTVSVNGEVHSASINICGLGHYELCINGTRLGDRQLEPAFSDYTKRVYTSTYDIAGRPVICKDQKFMSGRSATIKRNKIPQRY